MAMDFNLTVSWQYGDHEPAADPEAALHTSIQVLENRIKDWSDVFGKIATAALQPAVEEQIKSEGEELAAIWPKLERSTAGERARLGYGPYHPMLQREGDLIRSFSSGDRNHVQNISAEAMEWGSALPYALFHQTGTQQGYRISQETQLDRLSYAIKKTQGARDIGMPSRPLIRMTEELEAQIMLRFNRAVHGAAQEAHMTTESTEEVTD